MCTGQVLAPSTLLCRSLEFKAFGLLGPVRSSSSLGAIVLGLDDEYRNSTPAVPDRGQQLRFIGVLLRHLFDIRVHAQASEIETLFS